MITVGKGPMYKWDGEAKEMMVVGKHIELEISGYHETIPIATCSEYPTPTEINQLALEGINALLDAAVEVCEKTGGYKKDNCGGDVGTILRLKERVEEARKIINAPLPVGSAAVRTHKEE